MAIQITPRTPTVAITVLASNDTDYVVSPAAVWLDASVTGFRTGEGVTGVHTRQDFHEINYKWTVVGTPLTGGSRASNMITEWDKPNIAYGQNVSFCFDAPGTYTVTCEATDLYGNSATTTSENIVVRNPDDVFPNTQTICFSEANDFTGKPTGAQEITTRAALDTAVSSATLPTRILFRAGETFDGENTSFNGEYEFGLSPIYYIGSFGVGDKPIVWAREQEKAGLFLWGSANTNPIFTITDLDVRSFWDETKELGAVTDSLIDVDGNFKQPNSTICVHNIDSSGFNKGVKYQTGLATGLKWMVSQCHITNFVNYAVFGTDSGEDETSRLAIIDNDLGRGANSLAGGGRKSVRAHQHGCIRIPQVGYCYTARNYIFNQSGWGENLSHDPAYQACFRPNSNPLRDSFLYDTTWVVERNIMEGGLQIVDANTESDGPPTDPWNAIFENNLLICNSTNGGNAIVLGHGGTTIRNNYYWRPNRQEWVRSGDPVIVQQTILNNSNGNSAEPVYIYNNTMLIQANVASDPNDRPYYITTVNSGPAFLNLVEENNVIHAPDKTTPITSDGPFDLTTGITEATARYVGRVEGFDYFWDSSVAALANGATSAEWTYDNWTEENYMTTYYDVPNANLGEKPTAGAATTQSYWTSLPADNNQSYLRVDQTTGPTLVLSERAGDFTVNFTATGISITNTSGLDWVTGDWRLKIDRTANQPAMDTSRSVVSSTTPYPPECVPDTGSPSLGAADTGMCAIDDFLRTDRPSTGKDAGAFQT